MKNKGDWEKFWEYLLFKADKREEWWLCMWLEWKKKEFENENRRLIPLMSKKLGGENFLVSYTDARNENGNKENLK